MFDDRLRNARQRLGYTQRQVAEKAQINIASYSAYENDKSIPPLDIALRIADALETSLEVLCGRKEASGKLETLGDIARCIIHLGSEINFGGIRTAVRPDPDFPEEELLYVSVMIQDGTLYNFFEKRERLLQVTSDTAVKEMFDVWQESELKRLDSISKERNFT